MRDVLDICGIIVAVLALFVSVFTAFMQVQHNKNSVRPICAIIEKYHEHNVAVLIVNRGLGPLTIDSVSVRKNGVERDNLILFMPKVKQPWNGFSLEIKGRTVLPEREVVLCAIDPENQATKKRIMTALKDIEITVKFHDIYKKKYKVEKTLCFAQTLSEHFGYCAK